MKIAVTSTGTDLTAQVDPRFGRCPYFLFIDTDTMQFEAVENPNVAAMGGAGIQSAQLVANKGAQVVLTGSCGPNAFQTLQAAGVQVIIGVVGTVQDAIQRFKSGQLQPTAQPNVPPHFGMGTAQSGGWPAGPGFGMGRGMGRRLGRGMGGGGWPGMGYGPTPSAPGAGPAAPGPTTPQLTPDQELQMLKQQADFLKQQLDAITKRISELEEKK